MPYKIEPVFYDRKCKVCGKPGLHRRASICSRKCVAILKAIVARSKPPKFRKCEVCGKEFQFTPNFRANVRTCGVKCGGLLRRKRHPLTCLNCGKQFWRHASAHTRKYCSLRCATTHARTRLPVKCAMCKRIIYKSPATIRRVTNTFCGKECSWKFHRGAKSPTFRGGSAHFRGTDWDRQAKAARRRDKNICQVCGTPKQKGEALTVDHIIAYRIFPSNDLRNLLSICRAPCHSFKTMAIEPKILIGDRIGFLDGLRHAGWPMDRVEAALALFEQSPQLPLIKNGKGVAA